MCETPRVHLVAGDGGELRTAIFELVLNAMDALPNGGTIRVDTRDEGVRAVLTVQDDGPGPLAGMAETAFDPFISSKEEPDAGLGLSAAWGIARRHDGDLTLGTNDSGGGRAILTLPLLSVDS
jgi:two-component system sensor histidine kinase FlrB